MGLRAGAARATIWGLAWKDARRSERVAGPDGIVLRPAIRQLLWNPPVSSVASRSRPGSSRRGAAWPTAFGATSARCRLSIAAAGAARAMGGWR